MLLLTSVVFGFYFILLLFLMTGWRKNAQPVAVSYKLLRSVSVIVPFRNEERALPRLLESLARQTYPAKHWEVILVNDHSEDQSARLVEAFCREYPYLVIKLIHSSGNGKKHALDMGIRNSKGEIIITTDADCEFGTNWIASMVEAFTPGVNMVLGAIRLTDHRRLSSSMQAIEFASLVGSGASTLGHGIPSMCNGANLAFRKTTFFEVGGYESDMDIASGDDEFLMRKFAAVKRDGIVFNYSRESIVSSIPAGTLGDFINQRLRWASKWRYYPDLFTRLLALSILIFQCTYLALLTMTVAGQLEYPLTIALISLKMVGELLFLRMVSRWLGNKWSWVAFLLWQILYPAYAILIGVGSLTLGYRWKGRQYQPVPESW